MPKGKSRRSPADPPQGVLLEVSAKPGPTGQPSADSEAEAYAYIRERLIELGWNFKNPSLKSSAGQVWTQNQCLMHPVLKAAFGARRPEYVVKLTESLLWVIEAKAKRMQIGQALSEARDVYAEDVNALATTTKVILVSGVAGNDDIGYTIETEILLDGTWQPVTINGHEATGLIAPSDIEKLIRGETADVHDFVPPPRLFLQAAERINETLHIGGINKNDRAKTIAALLLSVIDQPPNLDTPLDVLIGEINARSEAVLRANDKPDFAPFVKILPPTNRTNHVKFKRALVKTIQELLDLNISSAMNSNTDVLGQFYEVFLKYGNGAKEIGIVLTPRHITRFGVEAVGLDYNDIVLDPACGTGGFLVAAFDHVRKTCTAQQLEHYKQYNLFGIEQESYVAVLAIVNMIFRGDGKHNIVEGNCFSTYLKAQAADGRASAVFSKTKPKAGSEAITRVLMNPPFALRASDEKEYRFVSHALSLMCDGGLLFSLVPLNALFGSKKEKVWRKTDLLSS